METEADLGDNELSASISCRRRSASVSDDYSVQKTNDDATESKFSAVKVGYWADSFIHHFIVNPEHIHRRAPEILRGYWARHAAFELSLKRISELAGENLQIISLGAGFDTLYFRLKERGVAFKKLVEVDFSSVTARKIRTISKNEHLAAMFDSTSTESQHSDLHSRDYDLLGADIRQPSEFWAKIETAGLDPSLPVVVIAECVLVYLDVKVTENLVRKFAEKFNELVFVSYEQVNMTDKFSDVMQANLQERGIHLAGLPSCNSLDSQKSRFLNNGYPVVNAWTMQDLYAQHFNKDEIARIEKLELLDERELLAQLLEHYCLVLAVKTNGLFAGLVF
ncbi:unnamed protein product [Bursaphelenchus okinawaensis]|uniref:Leucine carboxyl methyltransferase 1 n=1 Tax=Bursaphelenchus okinawaensis TaxID=465554 RepID=A0A811LQY2_9BILA|nr:unnamed protein product [Bursaphelenchus okinawaensis]CAG9126723.1 unnamed protein product [Bursaphelenchus okinawaensis]